MSSFFAGLWDCTSIAQLYFCQDAARKRKKAEALAFVSLNNVKRQIASFYCLKIKTTRPAAFSLFHSSFSPHMTFAIHLDRTGEYSPSNPDHFLTSPSLVNITSCWPRESEFCSYANSFVFQFLPKNNLGDPSSE